MRLYLRVHHIWTQNGIISVYVQVIFRDFCKKNFTNFLFLNNTKNSDKLLSTCDAESSSSIKQS